MNQNIYLLFILISLTFFLGCDSSSTSIPMDDHANRLSIPWEDGKSYNEFGIYDLDENGKAAYQMKPTKRPTQDPVFYAINTLTSGTLRSYVPNCRMSRIQLEEGAHHVFMLGDEVTLDKKREQEFMNFLRYTIEIYTQNYRFFMNEKEFKVN